MSERKYENLVFRFKPEYLATTVDGTEIKDKSPQAYFRGACQIPGSRFNVGYGYVTQPGIVDPYPHKHYADEYLVFGSGTLNAKDWDAHIELTIGLGDDAELYVIDEPMTIRIPAGIWHCPLNFVRITKPYSSSPRCSRACSEVHTFFRTGSARCITTDRFNASSSRKRNATSARNADAGLEKKSRRGKYDGRGRKHE
jgi:hypothetical protein